MEDNKPASNFELNVIKLGKHRFQLVKGDRFETNGSYFNFSPSTAENKGKGKFTRWSGRSNTISAKKYEKDVLRADNIKLIGDRPLFQMSMAEFDRLTPEEKVEREAYDIKNRLRTWEVQYAYEQPVEDKEKLVVMVIRQDFKYIGDTMNTKTFYTYTVAELEVERETKELYFLKGSHPVSYHSKIEKTDLNIVHARNGGTVYHVIGKVDNYHENEIALFNYAEKNQRSKIETAKNLVVTEELNLDNVLKLKQENGF